MAAADSSPVDAPAGTAPVLPGTTVVVRDVRSIYNGYRGFVQRISGSQAAVLFEGATGTSWSRCL